MKNLPTVTAPLENCSKFIKPGKTYQTIEFRKLHDSVYVATFVIKDEAGMRATCLQKGCAYLNGGNWTINETEE